MRIPDRVGRAAVGLVAVALVASAGACGGAGDAAAPAATPTASPTPTRSPRPAEVPSPGDHQLAMDWDGKERSYHLHAPPKYQPGKKLPLVVVMHYRGGTADSMRQMTLFDAKADREGFLVAYPNGLDGAVNALICCGSHDDVGFIRTMVEHITQTWGADPDRVYATGISNGADMSFRLAVEVPGMFAAIAPVSGGFIGQKATDDPAFKPSRTVSVVTFLGNDDPLVSPAVAGLHGWQRKVGCSEGPTGWVDRGKTVNRTTAKCADGSETVRYIINGMSHSWPGGTQVGLGDPTTKINAVNVMWQFFVAHPRRSG